MDVTVVNAMVRLVLWFACSIGLSFINAFSIQGKMNVAGGFGGCIDVGLVTVIRHYATTTSL